MTFAFRVDSSTRIGTGHLVRCLTLARALRSRGARAVFFCRQLEGAATSKVEESGFEVRNLGGGLASEHSTEREDAIETLKLIDECSISQVIVDNYDLSIEWESIVSEQVEKLTVIEDLTDRQHRCNLLLNQNLLSPQSQEYSASLSGVERTLVGPRYALLQPDYAEIRILRYDKTLDVKRIVVFMGGSDSENATEFVLKGLIEMRLAEIAIDVVIGSSNPHHSNLLQAFQDHHSVNFHFDLPTLAPLLATADMAIGAGGSSNWERMCLGVPSIVIDIAQNQRDICAELARAGLIEYMGSSRQISTIDFQKCVSKVILDRPLRIHYSLHGQITVDGLGAQRVVESLLPSNRDSLTLRESRMEDLVSYFNWVNDPTVRKNSLEMNTITWNEHVAWFTSRINSPKCRMFVLCSGSLPIGQIRFQRDDDAWSLNYSLDEFVRGRALGKYLVEGGIAEMKTSKADRLVAYVKSSNVASRRIFEQLGFDRSAQHDSEVDKFVYML